MKVAIIISKHTADRNILKYLDNIPENMSVHVFDKGCLEHENIDKEIDADLFVFATKHQSKEGVASLTCHPPGNWYENTAGGKKQTLNVAPAFYLKQFYLELLKYKDTFEGEITLETTHHGPFLEKPCIFVEIGSSEEQWKDERYGKIIADCIKSVFIQEEKPIESCIIFGGGHYNQIANKIMERTEYAVGHMCPKFLLQHLNEGIIQQAIEKTIPAPSFIALDWKGMGKEKKRVIEILEKMGKKWIRGDKLY